MVCVVMASPPSPVTATRATPAPYVTSRSWSATASPARTADAASTWSTSTSATVCLAPQVSAAKEWVKYLSYFFVFGLQKRS